MRESKPDATGTTVAKVFPVGWRERTATDAAERELQTLAQLAAGLADDCTVFHGVHWTQVERGSYAIDSRASSLPQRASPASSPRYPADPPLPTDIAKAMNACELCLGRERFAWLRFRRCAGDYRMPA